MSYEHDRIGKVDEWLMDQAIEAVEEHVLEHFGAEELSELTIEQIDEVVAYGETLSEHSLTHWAYKEMYNRWEWVSEDAAWGTEV